MMCKVGLGVCSEVGGIPRHGCMGGSAAVIPSFSSKGRTEAQGQSAPVFFPGPLLGMQKASFSQS